MSHRSNLAFGEWITYERRLDAVLDLVRAAGSTGITNAGLVAHVPWDANHQEVRAKLMQLRNWGCIQYDRERKAWFA